jgi:hypothetical protein
MTDDEKGLSREAARVVTTRRIKARSTIKHFLALLQELCDFDNITDEILRKLSQGLRICVVALGADVLIFMVAFSQSASHRLTPPLVAAIIAAVAISMAALFLYGMKLKYLRRDFLNDVFHVLPTFLEAIAQVVPSGTMVRLDLDLEGICKRKIAKDVTNTAELMKRVRYIDYSDPWLKMAIEFEDKSEININIENKMTRKISSVTRVTGGVMRKRHIHTDTWTNWTKQTAVKMTIVRKNGAQTTPEPREIGLAAWNQVESKVNPTVSQRNQTYAWNTENEPSWEVPPGQDLNRMFQDLHEILFPVSMEI